MKKFRLTLSLKVLTVVTVILTIVFAAVTPRVVGGVTNQAKQALIAQSKTFGVLATQPIGDAFLLYEDSGTAKLKERVRTYANLFSAVENVSIYDVQANREFSLQDTEKSLSLQEATLFEPEYVYNTEGYVERVIYPWIEGSGVHRYTFVYDISGAELKATVAQVSNSTIFAALFVLIILNTTVFLLLQFLFVRPIKSMSELALAIGAGQYDTRIKSKRRDEIGDLASSIDTMSTTLQADIIKLGEAEKLKTEFLIISSHNLRTPLTVVSGYIDLLKSMKLDESAKKYVGQIETKAKELTELTNDMLTIAEIEGGATPEIQKQTVNITNLLQEMKPEIEQRFSIKSLKLEISIPESNLAIQTQTTYLQTVLWNLLDNAIKFSPEGSKVALRVKESDLGLEIEVEDHGAGISEEELPKLFTKFHRGTSVMQYQYEGVGLGLYMTKLMLDMLGGTISAKSTLGQGSIFVILLPTTQ